MASSRKAIDKLERAKLGELRATVKSLPLSELGKLRREGLQGQPLFKALGFSSQLEEAAWLQDEEASAPARKSRVVGKARANLADVKKGGGDPWLRTAAEVEAAEVPSARQFIQDSEKSMKARLRTGAREVQKPSAVKRQSSEEDNSPTVPARKKSKKQSGEEPDPHAEEEEEEGEDEHKEGKEKSRKRKAPLERSSKHQVSRNRQVVQIPGFLRNGEDPRFSKQDVDLNLHRARYGFLEEIRNEEIEEKHRVLQRELLARQLKGTRRGRRLKRLTDDELSAMRSDLTRLEQHKAETERAKKIASRVSELKRENSTKKGFFIGKKTRKEIEQEVKMEDYKRRHKMERFEKREERKRVRKESKDKGPQLGL